MNGYVHAIAAALVTSVVIFCASFVYEGHRTRAVMTVKVEALSDEVKLLAARVRELEQAKK